MENLWLQLRSLLSGYYVLGGIVIFLFLAGLGFLIYWLSKRIKQVRGVSNKEGRARLSMKVSVSVKRLANKSARIFRRFISAIRKLDLTIEFSMKNKTADKNSGELDLDPSGSDDQRSEDEPKKIDKKIMSRWLQISLYQICLFWGLVWLVLAVPMVIMSRQMTFLPNWTNWVIPAVVLLVTGVVILFGYLLTYELAKISKFVTMTPEMSAVAIKKFRKLQRIFISVTDEGRDCFFRKLCFLKNKAAGYKKFVLLSKKRGGLCFAGIPPMNEIHEWTEIENGKQEKRSLSLAETTIDFEMQKGREEVSEADIEYVPNVHTADGIEVSAAFTFYLWVLDPERGLFRVGNRTTALSNIAFSAWRKTVGSLNYYNYEVAKNNKGDGNEIVSTLNAEILEKAAEKLEQELGLSDGKPVKDSSIKESKASIKEFEESIDDAETVDDLLDAMKGQRKGIAVDVILHDWGMLLRGIEIVDLQPTDSDIHQKIKELSTAIIEAEVKARKAKGEKQKLVFEGEGAAEAIEKQAAAYNKPGGDMVAARDIVANLPDDTVLVHPDLKEAADSVLFGKFMGRGRDGDQDRKRQKDRGNVRSRKPQVDKSGKQEQETKQEGKEGGEE